jgi:hypothetical protein
VAKDEQGKEKEVMSWNLVRKIVPIFAAIVGPAFGAEAIVPPEGGQDVITFTADEKLRLSRKAGEARGKWVEIEEMPFEKAYQVELIESPTLAKDLQLILPLEKSFKRGDSVLVFFWVRRPKSSGEPGPAAIYVQAGAGKKRFEFRFSPFRQWEQHARAFTWERRGQ